MSRVFRHHFQIPKTFFGPGRKKNSLAGPRKLKSGMSKMRIGQPQPQPQPTQPLKNDHNHNHNLTKSHTPTTTSTQFFYDKTPQPQPQPNFFQGKHHNPTTTQFFFQNHPNFWFYHNFTTKLG